MSVFNSPFNQVFRNPFNSPYSTVLGGWTPALWFQSSEQGIWLDPSDFTRHRGEKGPELVTNGDFATGISSWTANGPSISWSAGRLSYTSAAGGYITIPFSGVVVGKCYEVIVDVVSHASANLRFSLFGSTFIYTAAECTGRTMRHTVIATNTTATLDPYGGSSGLIDNVSIKEVTPDNTATLFQDSAGITPVTAVEQPVGLMLDKRLGLVLGPELVANGALTSGTGWADTGIATISYSAAGARITSPANGSALLQRSYAGAVNKTYAVEFEVLMHATPLGAATVGVNIGGAGEDLFVKTPSSLAAGQTHKVKQYVRLTTATTFLLRIGSGGGLNYALDFTIKNLSVRELPGNHASQATAASRPVLSARKNLLLQSENLGTAQWLDVQGASTYIGGKIVPASTTLVHGRRQQHQFVLGRQVTTSMQVKAGDAGVNLEFWEYINVGAVVNPSTWDVTDVNACTVVLGTTDADGYRTVSFTYTEQVTAAQNMDIRLTRSTLRGQQFVGDGVAGLYVRNVQKEYGSIATTYQRVNTATDYDTVGFPLYAKTDGVDDFDSSASGGGSSTAFFLCQAIKVNGGAGTARTIFSDAGTNTGYIVRVNASNQLELAAGNGTAYTTVATAGTLAVGTTNVITAWDDGTNLNVQIGNGTVASVARPVVVAGTAAITRFKDNGAASGFLACNSYGMIYRKDASPSAGERLNAKTYLANKAGVTL